MRHRASEEYSLAQQQVQHGKPASESLAAHAGAYGYCCPGCSRIT